MKDSLVTLGAKDEVMTGPDVDGAEVGGSLGTELGALLGGVLGSELGVLLGAELLGLAVEYGLVLNLGVVRTVVGAKKKKIEVSG